LKPGAGGLTAAKSACADWGGALKKYVVSDGASVLALEFFAFSGWI
jgi:hypothetical protein